VGWGGGGGLLEGGAGWRGGLVGGGPALLALILRSLTLVTGHLACGFSSPHLYLIPPRPCNTQTPNTNAASGSTTAMSSVWALLTDILAPARAKGLSPADGSADFMNALVQVRAGPGSLEGVGGEGGGLEGVGGWWLGDLRNAFAVGLGG